VTVELTERHREIIAGGAMFAGSVDREGRPDIIRVFGVKVHDDRRTLRVLLAAPWANKIVANVRDGGWFALSFTEPTTYQSFQAKGHVQRIEPPTEEDRALAAHHHAEFARAVISIGVHESARKYAHVPVVAVTFHIEQLFCQTPGPGAGDLVGGVA
jgi:hypothetical protein